ncbi:hypothetical protein [Sphingobacterium cellulitidis]|uniref:hypothetical protein n=1 Tax=Sphingobacterium cellulitidis TaxID=1768011 RepID=UPI000B93FC8C|nr:hypothetical protein CHT99_14890 [Sphingobacterium cellulitidis]
MKTVYFSQQINADPQKIHSIMLDEATYREWTKPFSPTSNIKGNWTENSTIKFTSLDNNGDEAGMISRVEKNIPGELVIIRHLGMFDKNGEYYEGEMIDNWKNALEIYRFNKTDDGTNVLCSVEISDEDDLHMFDQSWPEALNIVKQLSEK